MLAKQMLIIGCGGIGRRHLQGLVRATMPMHISLYDVQADAARAAAAEIQDGSFPQSISVAAINSFPQDQDIDVAIIATTSRPRRRVVEDLLARNRVTHLILEKVLFTQRSDYEDMAALVPRATKTAWVNTARRDMDLYRNLRNEIGGRKIHMDVLNGESGMGSNVIHLVDLACFLASDEPEAFSADFLDAPALPSKRGSYLDFTGTLHGRLRGGSTVVITAIAGAKSPPALTITTDDEVILILEGHKLLYRFRNGELPDPPVGIFMPLQSEMTGAVVQSLTSTGSCGLTPFRESVRQHVSLFEPIRERLGLPHENNDEDYPFS